MNPIVTIQLPGRGLAQGETVEPADERGRQIGAAARIGPPDHPVGEDAEESAPVRHRAARSRA